MCGEMSVLNMAETLASQLVAVATCEDTKTLYAQWTLDAQRSQRVHAKHCAVCKQEENQ